MFDGRWADGPDGAHLAGEFRPVRYAWLFYLLVIGMFTLTDFAVPAPGTSGIHAWAPVMLRRLAWVAGLIGFTAVAGRLAWYTVVKADMEVIRNHMKATFSRVDV